MLSAAFSKISTVFKRSHSSNALRVACLKSVLQRSATSSQYRKNGTLLFCSPVTGPMNNDYSILLTSEAKKGT